MMASYTWQFEKARLVTQLNINNLFDKRYFVSVNPSQATPGAPITVVPLLRLEF
jgi:outer membrane receptor protein involved in Fe transport